MRPLKEGIEQRKYGSGPDTDAGSKTLSEASWKFPRYSVRYLYKDISQSTTERRHPVSRKASITTIEFLLLCGCEITAQTLKDGFGYYWFLPCGTRCGPTDSIAELPEQVDDYLEDCFGSPADEKEDDDED